MNSLNILHANCDLSPSGPFLNRFLHSIADYTLHSDTTVTITIKQLIVDQFSLFITLSAFMTGKRAQKVRKDSQ